MFALQEVIIVIIIFDRMGETSGECTGNLLHKRSCREYVYKRNSEWKVFVEYFTFYERI